ncbi:B3 domain-containing protein At2g33720-like [Eucalyptus grandis]|uniref:B3 domain-containing protein At2g33720-like n=1 Tax=Eucalyptus grandis TaxID=71139 RepID=UPI00192ED80C|nr:B3 domain-containing protein At2g33720-like [Eucalyptus grandis]
MGKKSRVTTIAADETGLFWDMVSCKFHLTVLNKVAHGSSSASTLPCDFTKLQLGCPGSSSSSSTTQNAIVVTPQERDLPEKDLKRKRSSRSVVPNNNARPVRRHEEEEKDDAGISTKLTLLNDPWLFKKKLKASDVDHSSRLLLAGSFVHDHVLKEKGEEMVGLVKSRTGIEVPVWDADTSSEHQLVFGYWESTKGYVLKGGWIPQFVERRGLVVGDEIGMFWNERERERMFYFKVLHKVARGTSNEAA